MFGLATVTKIPQIWKVLDEKPTQKFIISDLGSILKTPGFDPRCSLNFPEILHLRIDPGFLGSYMEFLGSILDLPVSIGLYSWKHRTIPKTFGTCPSIHSTLHYGSKIDLA